MKLDGGCYCGALRYSFEGDAIYQGQCHCRECQYITGGHPNAVFGLPAAAFQYTKGEPQKFTRADLPAPVTREFCGTCGTHICGRPQQAPIVNLKVGTLDDPSIFGTVQFAIYVKDKQPFHHLPDGAMSFEAAPPR